MQIVDAAAAAGAAVRGSASRRAGWGLRQSAWAIAMAALAACPIASQAAYVCTGKIIRLETGPGGDVTISLQGEGVSLSWQHVCNTRVATAGVEPAACKPILATLMAAYLTDRTITLWFDASYTGPAKCTDADHPPWNYLGNSGWYWGPAIP
jgi:hypothetical protein